MDLLTKILIAIYLVSALTFFIYMFRKGNPAMVQKKIEELFDNPDFVERTMKISQDMLIHKIINDVLPLIFAGTSEKLTEQMNEHLKEIPLDLGDDFWLDFTNRMNLWWANLHKKVGKEQKLLFEEAKDVMMAGGEVPGIDPSLIMSETLSKKYPAIGWIMQMAQARGQGSDRASLDQTGGGRKPNNGW